MSIHKMLELHELAKEAAGKFPRKRELSLRLELDEGRHMVGLVGARGVGKTVLLRQIVADREDAFYLSADTLEADDDLWELMRSLVEHYGFRISSP